MGRGILKQALFATFVAVLATASGAAAASPDAEFVAGLAERRLFPLAEKFLRARLGEQNLTSDERVDLTIALARTCAEHALHSPRRPACDRCGKPRPKRQTIFMQHFPITRAGC